MRVKAILLLLLSVILMPAFRNNTHPFETSFDHVNLESQAF